MTKAMTDSMEGSLFSKPGPQQNSLIFQELLDHMSDGVLFVDSDRRIHYSNRATEILTGHSTTSFVGRACPDAGFCHSVSDMARMCRDRCPIEKCIDDGQAHETKIYLQRRSGRKRPALIRVRPIKDSEGIVSGAFAIFSDDSAQSDAGRKIESMRKLAYLDHLTQLPNRRFLEGAIASSVTQFQVSQDPFAVMVIDLDEFKGINDCFGHAAGDQTLRLAGETLVQSLRPTDIVGRWGGDEFVAVVHGVDWEILQRLASRCVRLIKQALVATDAGCEIPLSASIGAALARPGENADEIMQRADELMYRSKAAGRGCAHSG